MSIGYMGCHKPPRIACRAKARRVVDLERCGFDLQQAVLEALLL